MQLSWCVVSSRIPSGGVRSQTLIQSSQQSNLVVNLGDSHLRGAHREVSVPAVIAATHVLLPARGNVGGRACESATTADPGDAPGSKTPAILTPHHRRRACGNTGNRPRRVHDHRRRGRLTLTGLDMPAVNASSRQATIATKAGLVAEVIRRKLRAWPRPAFRDSPDRQPRSHRGNPGYESGLRVNCRCSGMWPGGALSLRSAAFRRNDHNRAAAVVDQAVLHASEYDRLHLAESARADHNQLGVALIGEVQHRTPC